MKTLVTCNLVHNSQRPPDHLEVDPRALIKARPDGFDFSDVSEPFYKQVLINKKYTFEIEIHYQFSSPDAYRAPVAELETLHVRPFPLMHEDLLGLHNPEQSLRAVDRFELSQFLMSELDKLPDKAVVDEAQREYDQYFEHYKTTRHATKWSPDENAFLALGLINLTLPLVCQFLKGSAVHFICELASENKPAHNPVKTNSGHEEKKCI